MAAGAAVLNGDRREKQNPELYFIPWHTTTDLDTLGFCATWDNDRLQQKASYKGSPLQCGSKVKIMIILTYVLYIVIVRHYSII